ncbi:nitrous oxide reductase family maturation protein NosD [Pseudoduganella sp. DS3]|uniref:Nitrous oxide reductase family maturation protein NosD n=1 Tax=Pseudoduganella guangdongensis TaxID=2692179 RepID=A0A6N9HHB9_9BURK|nr:nitrous oxide reductase family maturation protein NosD [Pseudoduganella guangdongensis]MYN02432.1 nitrous oxide reductase family maturation protein NosD [Pseudoduganella guangdongensis]
MSVLRLCAAALAAFTTALPAAGAAPVVAGAVSARPHVLQVRQGESIAAAIRLARPGDTVQVREGTYRERLIIDKPIRLEGIGKPTISAAYEGDVIRVKAKDVTIRGLIVRDSGIDLGAQNAGIYVMPGSDGINISNCDLVTNLFGIWLEQSRDAVLQGNLITGRRDLMSQMRGNGIQVYNTDDTQVIDNTVSYARDGIYVDYSRRATFRGNRVHHVRYGTHYMNTHDSIWEGNTVHQSRGGLALMEVRNLTVRNNVAWGNEDHGIMLRTIQDSVIENNIVSGNGRGFFIYDAEFNTLRGNLVIGNQTGVHLTAGSSNNAVDGNDFINNAEQVKFVASKDVEWGRSRGNYWSNYSGWDQDNDGQGDVLYQANDVVDRLHWQYPLLKLLLSSPAVQTLRFVSRQFPLLRAPSVIDQHARMQPWNTEWRKWHGRQAD